jgi:hypothetical protein
MTATEQWIFLCAAHKTPKEVRIESFQYLLIGTITLGLK